jgi:hypothetical protein
MIAKIFLLLCVMFILLCVIDIFCIFFNLFIINLSYLYLNFKLTLFYKIMPRIFYKNLTKVENFGKFKALLWTYVNEHSFEIKIILENISFFCSTFI